MTVALLKLNTSPKLINDKTESGQKARQDCGSNNESASEMSACSTWESLLICSSIVWINY